MTDLARPPLKRHERSQRAYRSAVTTFILVAFFVSVLAVYSAIHPADLGAHLRQDESRTLVKRGAEGVSIEDLECRLVHRAHDKCAFVRENCVDEEAGLFSYLQLYYCTLPHAQPVAFALIVLWLCLLFSTIGIAASDFFCINLSTIAHLLGLSESLAGVTFLAFGNGSPDVFSTFAAMSTNSGSLAIGELIGAASFITAVVAGAMAFVRPFKVARKSFVRDVSFFIVAATFAMVFLYDGKLHLWESVAMVGLYVFYVIFVVIWHWWFNRRKRRRQAEAAARGAIVGSGSEVAEFPAYHDDDEPVQDGDDGQPVTPKIQRGMSSEDISLLERGRGSGDDYDQDDQEEEDEDHRQRALGEISREMLVRRPQATRTRTRERRGTHNPVRPSLIGALEFRSVLSGLQRSGNIQAYPLNHRRHSDDAWMNNAPSDARSMISEPGSRAYQPSVDAADWNPENQHSEAVQGLRSRAISAPDPSMIRHAADQVPRIDLLGPLNEEDALSRASSRPQQTGDLLAVPTSPSVSVSPPGSRRSSQTSRSNSPSPSHSRSVSAARSTTSSHLAPPIPSHHQPQIKEPQEPYSDSPTSPQPMKPSRPALFIPTESAPFPPYRDYLSPGCGRSPSIRLPSPAAVYTSNPIEEAFRNASPPPPRWWPSRLLPSPVELYATLFPTIFGWAEKNWWARLLGIVAAPSVFVLTVTLPVVEMDQDDEGEDDDDIPDLTLPSTYNHSPHIEGRPSFNSISITVEDESTAPHHGESTSEPFLQGIGAGGAQAAISQENIHRVSHQHADSEPPPHPHYARNVAHHHVPAILTPLEHQVMQSPEQMPADAAKALPFSNKDWTRWLIILQTFTAPFFISLIVWAKMLDEDSGTRELVRAILISLVVSLVGLGALLATTTADKAPRWRAGLCFVGFLVSITWISSIADEVVGVLKSIGVILNISDAILGLTIFAVGNSLGDLVADYTVAKLGYPVMALSACFGGPMLNILLGVGLSGTYLILKGAQRKVDKHPGHPFHPKPFKIEVSRTLMISGATLLVTLLGLLVIVPLRRWKMDRFVGWCLVVLWGVSTVCNVLVEVLGLDGKLSS